ncbi:MAG: hypothetical protein U5K79_19350 [Cyclobacteriaceae bacterium]|nr:hypothetical protein [Cyclobacteriaceae bacterium]
MWLCRKINKNPILGLVIYPYLPEIGRTNTFYKKGKKVTDGMYPEKIEQITHPYDKLEHVLIDKPIYVFRWLLNRFVFLQNGNLQYYILYGFVFVTAAILLPFFISKVMVIINFLNQQ